MPVLDACRDFYHIARTHAPGPAPCRYDPVAGRHDEHLPDLVGVPSGASTRKEIHPQRAALKALGLGENFHLHVAREKRRWRRCRTDRFGGSECQCGAAHRHTLGFVGGPTIPDNAAMEDEAMSLLHIQAECGPGISVRALHG